MASDPTLVVFSQPNAGSACENLVGRVASSSGWGASLLALEAGYKPVIIVTNQATATAVPNVIYELNLGPFHFGRRLADVLRRHELTQVLYMGAGSAPLYTADDFRSIAKRLEGTDVVTNNLFSSDLISFRVTERAIGAIENLDRDNMVARALKDECGMAVEQLPRSLKTVFDIDTPTDVAILFLTGFGNQTTLGATHNLHNIIDLARYRAVLPLFLDQAKQIVVAGRVGSHAWSYLERETACRVRLFAEERGMEADGRAERGEARSLLGHYLQEVGVERFFETLAGLGDAAFIDTRVLLAHKRIDASREDRFLSDLGDWEGIRNGFLREFTRAALQARIPVLLGGHSLMSGGLMALNEYAWSLRDASEL